MRTALIMLLVLVACEVVGAGRAPAQADELWQQLPPPAAMPKAEESGYAPVNDIQMYYAVFRSGEPVILLHGGLANADYWGNQVPDLAEHYKVIVAESRGHGRSTRTAEPYSYQLMASDDKAAIVGWSDGGIIGLDLAMSHPERLTKLFAFGANYNVGGLRDDIGTSKTFNAYIEMAGHDYQRLSKTPDEYDAFVEQISGMWNSQPDYTPDQLGKITVPTVIADGAHDEGIRQEHTKQMAALIPGAKLLILPDVSHFAMWQNPAEFNQAVLDFLMAP
jgi:pimeloyl-ACP methyl ester carboxylesterase